MRRRRFCYILYTFIFVLAISVMTYLLFNDDLPHKVPLRAKEVFNYSHDKVRFYHETSQF
jgi:hypothetical protein